MHHPHESYIQKPSVAVVVWQVQRDIEDYSNALNRLQQQLDKISGAASEEQVSTGF